MLANGSAEYATGPTGALNRWQRCYIRKLTKFLPFLGDFFYTTMQLTAHMRTQYL